MNRLLPFLLAPIAAMAANSADLKIERLDPALDRLIPADAKIEKLAEGFTWSEGPTWYNGSLVFSDVPENVIYRWTSGATKAVPFLKPSGMLTPREGFHEQGSNGLSIDAEGRLLICQHGERRVARLEKDGKQTALTDKFEGKHFNSPNDLVVTKNGEIYFTDPPYGLDKGNESPLKEISFNGVYRLTKNGELSAVIKDLTFPNGIALNPDEKTLYIAVSDPKAPRLMAYSIEPDGSLSNGRVFFDAAPLVTPERKGLPDGLKVDRAGNVFTTGPGGVLIISPEGKHLGSILTGQPTGNCAWGDDGSTLYITANMFLCRVKTTTNGFGTAVPR
ncbi:MAG: Gluconolactonase [Chthoniobacteraceae bacterium]|nr:Gluconolactonase [Chthoniobacteraceae bacterium]